MLTDEMGQVGIGRYNSQLTGPAFTSGADVVCLERRLLGVLLWYFYFC